MKIEKNKDDLSGPHLRVLCVPYHLYTHRDAFTCLFNVMEKRGAEISLLLPFTNSETLERMTVEAKALDGVIHLHDFTNRRLISKESGNIFARLKRATALALYFVRSIRLLGGTRPDVILLTSDLGGVSVRFIQLVAVRLGITIVTLQTTLFLRVAERTDLKFQLKPRWLHHLFSLGILKKLFLYFGEVPGTFLPQSYLCVQDDEIRRVCIEFGKQSKYVKVFGSLQAAQIRAKRVVRERLKSEIEPLLPRVLILSECINERFGDAMGMKHIEWIRSAAQALAGRAVFSVRFHPRESDSYRDFFIGQLGQWCSIDEAVSAPDAVAASDVIVGSFSMLMFDAQAAGVSTVFLDVGADPIGFYSEKRLPLAASSVELVRHISQALESPFSGTVECAADPTMWGQSIIKWIDEIACCRVQ